MIIKGDLGEVHLYAFEYIISIWVQLLCFGITKSLAEKSGLFGLFLLEREHSVNVNVNENFHYPAYCSP